MSTPDYSSWALGCLFRVLRKDTNPVYGDADIVSRWCLQAEDMFTLVPKDNSFPQTAGHWIEKYFLPEVERKGIDHDVILEIRRRLSQYKQSQESAQHATQTP